MKALRLLLIISLIAVASCSEEPEIDDILYYGYYTNAGTAIKTKPGTRPRVAPPSFMPYNYGPGWMTVTLPSEIAECEITIASDSVIVWEGTVSADAPALVIPDTLRGSYTLRCLTPDGTEYEGPLTY